MFCVPRAVVLNRGAVAPLGAQKSSRGADKFCPFASKLLLGVLPNCFIATEGCLESKKAEKH